MRRSVTFFISHIFFCCILLLVQSGEAQDTIKEISPVSESPSTQSLTASDTLFVEILLNSHGVIAYDSLGNLWEYNFEQFRFIFSKDQELDERFAQQSESSTEIPPVAERCVDRRTLSDFEESVILIGYDEYIQEDIFAYGKVTVKGWVQGNIKSQTGPVIISSSGQVDGDIRAPEITIRDNGILHGQQIISDKLEIPELLISGFSTDGIWVVFIFTILTLLLSFLFASLFPRNINNVADCLQRHTVRSVLMGALIFFLLPVFVTILTLTIVGIVLIPVLILAYISSLVLAMIFVGLKIDSYMLQRLMKRERSLIFKSLLGVLLFMSLWFSVAVLLGSGDVVSQGIGIFLLVISILINVYYLFTGAGAVLLTRFGARTYYSYRDKLEGSDGEKLSPAPPPIPNAPPITTPISDKIKRPEPGQERNSSLNSLDQPPSAPLSSNSE